MKIKAIETFSVTLPFRFAFGHSLATRADSTNLFVRVTLDDGTQGYGEGVPRDYVTGENSQAAETVVERDYAPKVIGLPVSEPAQVMQALEETFTELGLNAKAQGASWCALELAIIDAVAKAHQIRVCNWFGPVLSPRIRYGGVVPFGGKKALLGMLLAYKLAGFKTVKVKVGKCRSDDLAKVALSRKIMGPHAIVRVDANCAWNVDQALQAAEDFRPYNVASYEQPVPPNRLDWLQTLTAQLPEQVVVDESLCTLDQAEMLAAERICSAFNIRLSKVGGLLAAQKMVAIADRHGVKCHLGAQVGESGILSAAARVFAACNLPLENYEGSMNGVLLRQDVTAENLTAGYGGFGDLAFAHRKQFGFGFSVAEGTLESWVQAERAPAAEPVMAAKTT